MQLIVLRLGFATAALLPRRPTNRNAVAAFSPVLADDSPRRSSAKAGEHAKMKTTPVVAG
jgi:hypothetical protein